MSFKIEHQILDSHILAPLEIELDRVRCQADEVLIHQGHVPKFGIIVLEQPIVARYKKKEIALPPYSIVGADELYNKIPLGYSVVALGGAEFLLLDRTSVLEGISGRKKTGVSQIFESILVLG